jgi:DNA-binding transcriptional ArsR family regulator
MNAVTILSAPGQPTRLETFRFLVKNGPGGVAASEIAVAIGVPGNTMSAHLAILSKAQLVDAERFRTRIYYRPRLQQAQRIVQISSARLLH